MSNLNFYVMSVLETVPKNGSLAKQRSLTNFPFVSSWLRDMFIEDFPTIGLSGFNSGITLPKVNITELDDSFQLEMAAPGFKKNDLEISVEHDSLTISGEMKSEENHDDFIRKEFGYGSFKRTFTLPESIIEEKIKASFADGILKLNLPKTQEAIAKPPRQIKIS